MCRRAVAPSGRRGPLEQTALQTLTWRSEMSGRFPGVAPPSPESLHFPFRPAVKAARKSELAETLTMSLTYVDSCESFSPAHSRGPEGSL